MSLDDAQLTSAFNRAKISLMTKKNSVFITTILFSLKHKWEESIDTADVDGVNLRINPQWFMDMPAEARIGLLAHEAWHVAFSHMLRAGHREPGRWNEACDYVINNMLRKAGYQLPEGGLWNSDYDEMSSEQVYDILEKKPDRPKNKMPDLVPADGNQGASKPDPSQGNSDKAKQEAIAAVENAVTDALIKATTQSKMSGDSPGTVPGDIAVALDNLLHPKLPWEVILAQYLNSMEKTDYSWSKFNKRFLPEFYLPTLWSESLGHIAWAIDTSCSVTDHQFKVMANEMENVQQRMGPEMMTICDFDTQIHEIYELHPGDSVLDIDFHGRGGTALEPVFEHYNKPENKPQVLIVMSDMYVRNIPLEDKPDYPVIWICIDNPNCQVEFGKLIHMETT